MFDAPVYPDVMPNLTQTHGFPVREDILATDKVGKPIKFFKASINNMLTAIAPVLRRVLEPEEVVCYVASAVDPISILTSSAYMRAVFMVTLIFTDRRLLAFNMTSARAKGAWRGNIQSLRWSDVASYKASMFGGLQITVQGVAKPVQFKTSIAAKVNSFLPMVMERARGESPRNEGYVSLCARCIKPLMPGVYICHSCGLAYKNEDSLLKSCLLPGGPYFYAKMALLGVMTAISQVFALGVLLLFAIVSEADALGAGVFFAAVLILSQIIAYFTARKMIRKHLPANMSEVELPTSGITNTPITR